MWIVYALAASVIWGISYAASGRVIERGMTPLVFFFLYTLFGAAAAAAALALTGKTGTLFSEFRAVGADWVWLVVAVVSSAAGALHLHRHRGEECHARFVDRNLLPVFRGGICVAFFVKRNSAGRPSSAVS